MAEDRGTLRAISWHEAFPALTLFAALRIALKFRSLLLATVALVFTSAGWWVCGQIFSGSEDVYLLKQIDANSTWPWEWPEGMLSPEQLTSSDTWRLSSPLVHAWHAIAAPFTAMYAADITFTNFVYIFVCALWSLAIWSFFGAAITRTAAISLARQEEVAWKPLLAFVRDKWGSYFTAPLFPILGTFLLSCFLTVLGLVMRLGPGVLVGGIVWPLALVTGFMMAFLLIGLFFSWPLMWGAISTEGTDAFGALSHSYSYTYQRPLQYLFYALGAALIGVLGWLLVSIFVTWSIEMTYWGVSWGAGLEQVKNIRGTVALEGGVAAAGQNLVHFWNGCLRLLARGFLFSYLWSASTVIYFLLRRLVDATEMDEVYLPEDQATHGLPPLKTGPDGVADVADEVAMTGGETE